MEKWTALFMQIIVPVKCLNEISILFAIVRVYSKSMLHVGINKSHVNIVISHVDIIYLACRGQKYATIHIKFRCFQYCLKCDE